MKKQLNIKTLINKLKLITLLLFLTFFCSSCVRVEQTISLDNMGNYENLFLAFANKNACEFMENMRDEPGACKSEFRNRLSTLGFTEIYDSDNSEELGVAGKFNSNISKLKLSDINNNAIEIIDNSKNYFVYKIYDISVLYKPYNIGSFLNGNNQCLINNYKFTLNLPVIATSNADYVSSDNKVHTWNIKPNSSNQIDIKFGMLNIINIIISIAILLVIFTLLTVLILIAVKKHKDQKEKV